MHLFILKTRSTQRMVLVCWKENGKDLLRMKSALGHNRQYIKRSKNTSLVRNRKKKKNEKLKKMTTFGNSAKG